MLSNWCQYIVASLLVRAVVLLRVCVCMRVCVFVCVCVPVCAVGSSDGNINRKRIRAIRQELEKFGWASVGF